MSQIFQMKKYQQRDEDALRTKTKPILSVPSSDNNEQSQLTKFDILSKFQTIFFIFSSKIFSFLLYQKSFVEIDCEQNMNTDRRKESNDVLIGFFYRIRMYM